MFTAVAARNRVNQSFLRVNWGCSEPLIETTKIHGIDPQAYSIDIVAKFVDGCRAYKFDELLP